MKFSLALLTTAFGAASAFQSSSKNSLSTSLNADMAEDLTPRPKAINGWVPDSSKPCFGLPGAIAPLGFFDPLGFTKDKSLNEVKRIREAEVMHSRVAMMAVVGYLITENTPTIAFGTDHSVIANNQLALIPLAVVLPFFLAINFTEAWRANVGWVEPNEKMFALREKYYPGDIGFDPVGFKDTTPEGFANLASKELSNGRLAMIAVFGMCVQELVNGMPVLEAAGLN